MYLRAALLGAKIPRVSSLPSMKMSRYTGWEEECQNMLAGEPLQHNFCGVVKWTVHVCRVPDMGTVCASTVLIFMQNV
jgi:hypothetical protein